MQKMVYQRLAYWVKKSEIFFFSFTKNLILLNTTTPTFANSVDPDQMASEEAIWSGSALFVMQFMNWMNTLYQEIWLVDSQQWVWLN